MADAAEPAAGLKRSPLHEQHVALGAKFAEFGGWEMPVEYPAGTLKEHAFVRDGVGIFDVSHLGKAFVRGPGAKDYVNSALSNDLDRIQPGKAQYTLCLDDATGGIVDDLIAYLKSDDEVFLIPNASNTAEVVRRLAASAPAGIEVTNAHDDYVVLAVQGTKSDEVLEAMGLPTDHDYMSFETAGFEGVPITVCRTGYTGERGYELVAPVEIATPLWLRLAAEIEHYDGLPCGLGSRDTLRTEMGYPLHGQDISPSVSPVEARLGWAVGWSKPAFWGKDIVAKQKADGPARLLRGLVANGRGIPRPHMSVSLTPDVPVGEITSGTFSPTLKKGIGLALIASQVQDGAEVSVDVRGRREIFTVTKPPFVVPEVRES